MTTTIPTHFPRPAQPHPNSAKINTALAKAHGTQFGGSTPLETIDPNDLEAIQKLPHDLSLQQVAMRIAPKTSSAPVMKYLVQGFKQRYKNVDHPVNPLLKNTLLHIAVSKGNPKLVEILLKAGANPLTQNKKGEDAFEWAETKMSQAASPADRLRIQQMLAKQPRVSLQQPSSEAQNPQEITAIASSWLSFSWLNGLSAWGKSASGAPESSNATASIPATPPETPTPEMPEIIKESPQAEALGAQNAELSKQLSTSKAQNAAIIKQLNETKKVIQHLEKEPSAARTENKQLRAQLSRLTQEKNETLGRLEATLKRVTEERDQQQTQLNQLEQQVITLEESRKESQSKHQKISEKEIKQQERLKNRLTQKAEQVTRLNLLLESQRQDYEASIQRLRNEQAAERINWQLQPQPAEAHSAEVLASPLDIKLRRENQELKQKAGKLHHQVNYLKSQLTQANKQFQQSQTQYRAWISRLFNDNHLLHAHLTQTQWERDEKAYIMQHGQQAGQQLLTDFHQQEMTLQALHQTLTQQQEQLEQQAHQHDETLAHLHSQKTILAKTVEHLMHLSAVRQGLATKESMVTQTVLDDLQTVLDSTQSPDAAQAALAQAFQFRQRQAEKSPMLSKLANLQAMLTPENQPDSANTSAQRPKTLLRSRSFS